MREGEAKVEVLVKKVFALKLNRGLFGGFMYDSKAINSTNGSSAQSRTAFNSFFI